MINTPDTLAIILASSSPRRQQLLSLAEIKFSTLSVDIDESINALESPQDYIVRMVNTKALEAGKRLFADDIVGNEPLTNHQSTNNLSIGAGLPKGSLPIESLSIKNTLSKVSFDIKNLPIFKLVITADTIGVLPDNRSILVKPVDKADAFAMWQKMSGQVHSVWTAVQFNLLNVYGVVVDQETVLEKTEVAFIELSKQDMEAYWQMGESHDKAGGYAIQGRGAMWVERINGSYTNVVGLPLAQTLAVIKKQQQRASIAQS